MRWAFVEVITSDATATAFVIAMNRAADSFALTNADATEDDGSCDFCSCAGESTGGEASGYALTVEEHCRCCSWPDDIPCMWIW